MGIHLETAMLYICIRPIITYGTGRTKLLQDTFSKQYPELLILRDTMTMNFHFDANFGTR